jgi:hypothetical protein
MSSVALLPAFRSAVSAIVGPDGPSFARGRPVRLDGFSTQGLFYCTVTDLQSIRRRSFWVSQDNLEDPVSDNRGFWTPDSSGASEFLALTGWTLDPATASVVEPPVQQNHNGLQRCYLLKLGTFLASEQGKTEAPSTDTSRFGALSGFDDALASAIAHLGATRPFVLSLDPVRHAMLPTNARLGVPDTRLVVQVTPHDSSETMQSVVGGVLIAEGASNLPPATLVADGSFINVCASFAALICEGQAQRFNIVILPPHITSDNCFLVFSQLIHICAPGTQVILNASLVAGTHDEDLSQPHYGVAIAALFLGNHVSQMRRFGNSRVATWKQGIPVRPCGVPTNPGHVDALEQSFDFTTRGVTLNSTIIQASRLRTRRFTALEWADSLRASREVLDVATNLALPGLISSLEVLGAFVQWIGVKSAPIAGLAAPIFGFATILSHVSPNSTSDPLAIAAAPIVTELDAFVDVWMPTTNTWDAIEVITSTTVLSTAAELQNWDTIASAMAPTLGHQHFDTSALHMCGPDRTRLVGSEWRQWTSSIIGVPSGVLVIGSLEGAFPAIWFRDLVPTGPHIFIDAGRTLGFNDVGPRMAAIQRTFTMCNLPIYPTFLECCSNFGLTHILGLIEDGEMQRLSVVLVDGSHQVDDALSDFALAFQALDIGGIMVFDDYECQAWDPLDSDAATSAGSPRRAVIAFLSMVQNCYQILPCHAPTRQMAILKTADQFLVTSQQLICDPVDLIASRRGRGDLVPVLASDLPARVSLLKWLAETGFSGFGHGLIEASANIGLNLVGISAIATRSIHDALVAFNDEVTVDNQRLLGLAQPVVGMSVAIATATLEGLNGLFTWLS